MSWQLISAWKRKAAAIRQRLDADGYRWSVRAIGEAQGYLTATDRHIQALAKSLNAKRVREQKRRKKGAGK